MGQSKDLKTWPIRNFKFSHVKDGHTIRAIDTTRLITANRFKESSHQNGMRGGQIKATRDAGGKIKAKIDLWARRGFNFPPPDAL